jgi:hypothetical protein
MFSFDRGPRGFGTKLDWNSAALISMERGMTISDDDRSCYRARRPPSKSKWQGHHSSPTTCSAKPGLWGAHPDREIVLKAINGGGLHPTDDDASARPAV